MTARVRGALPVTCASVLAVAVLAAVLLGLAGQSGASSPDAASSGGQALDAGIAHVQTVRGVLVLDPPYRATSTFSRMAWTAFTATATGDRKADVHYAVDWARAQRAYAAALARPRKTKGSLPAAQYAQQLKDLKAQQAVATRTQWVVNAARRTSTLVFFYADPLTRRPARAKYMEMGPTNGLPPTPDHTYSLRVWELATQLRAMMAEQSGIAVAETTVDGQPGYRVDVPASGDTAAWTALIDKASGLTAAVRLPAATTPDRADFNPPFHVTKLVVNDPLPAGAFTVTPDYRVLPHPAGVPQVVTMDFGGPKPGETLYSPPGRLRDVAPPSTLLPSRVPSGYRLALVERRTIGAVPFTALTYRRGMNAFVVWSGDRLANVSVDDSGVAESDRIAAFDRTTWPPLGGPLSAVVATDAVSGGAFDGAPAAASAAGVGFPTELQAWTATKEADLRGDLTRAEILSVAGSLQPLESGAWHEPAVGVPALIAVVAAAVAAAATVWFWVRARRRTSGTTRPRLTVLTWPLVGLALVIAGACLDWHALLHNGPAWGIRGWDEPLGRWVIAAAIAAVACAAWRQLAARRRGPVGLRFLSVLLAAVALAGSAFALVYLPLVARFTVQPDSGGDMTAESWLLRIVSSRFSPSATTGLYVSIVGVLLLFAGIVMLRAPQPAASEAALAEASAEAATEAAVRAEIGPQARRRPLARNDDGAGSPSAPRPVDLVPSARVCQGGGLSPSISG